jgi:hypothetical protein
MAAARRGLPTRAEFLNDRLQVLDQCDICHEPFDAVHKPARIRARKCQHTFGATCLRKWVVSDQENSDKCPLCREILFYKPRAPKFVEGERSQDTSEAWLHNVDDKVELEKFVKIMWLRLWNLFDSPRIYDSDIEREVNSALFTASQYFNHESGLFIGAEYWPDVRNLAQMMIKVHYANAVYRSCESKLRIIWMPELLKALRFYDEVEDDSDLEIYVAGSE